tara:strand:+ start:3194 stop:4450 length:1257 start_codon:yes stop_codon:yes gene_type:complete
MFSNNKKFNNEIFDFFSGTLLRSISILSRFLLIFILINKLSLIEFSNFGLISVSVTYLVYLFGYELHNYTSKELIKTNVKRWSFILFNRLYFSLISFFILFISLFFLNKYLVFFENIYIFILIILFEHLITEINRVFYIIGNYRKFLIFDFVRKSLFPFIIIIFIYLFKYKIDLDFVIKVWLLSNIVSMSLSFFYLIKMNFKISGNDFFFNINFLLSGIKESTPLLISIIIGNFVFIADRYFLKIFFDEFILSSYMFFIAISLLPLSIVDGTVVTKHLRSFLINSNKNISKFKLNFLKSLKLTLLIIFFFDFTSIILIDEIIQFTGKKILSEYIFIFHFLIIMGNLVCINKILEMSLYALNLNLYILKSNILLIIIFFISSFFSIVQKNNIEIFLIGLLISFIFSIIYKFVFIYKKIN